MSAFLTLIIRVPPRARVSLWSRCGTVGGQVGLEGSAPRREEVETAEQLKVGSRSVRCAAESESGRREGQGLKSTPRVLKRTGTALLSLVGIRRTTCPAIAEPVQSPVVW